ncbi:O-acyltransferase like protein [Drosophila pseudoobscura]|uniref:O-acyltransferase like protein n=1 Tax=Drosophila pseudoobscura pseudoobscura TaxID=46245 RepID=A0A6I8UGW4_DROPS|nr:O-acyltransferase like protein [Drosophila pseudoobscura]
MLIILLLIKVLAVLGKGWPWENKSLLVDIVETVPKSSNATMSQCEKQLLQLSDALQGQKFWALKALDASGEGFSNIMMGPSLWLGSRATCRAVNEPMLLDLTAQMPKLLVELAPFAFDYQVAYIRARSPWQISVSIKEDPMLHIGLCLPSSCSPPRVERLLRQALITGQSFQRWDMRPQLEYVKKPQLKQDFYKSRTLHLVLGVITGILLLTVLAVSGLDNRSRIVACFNVSTNWQRLYQEVNPSQENSVINGLRVYAAFTLLGVHVIWYKYFSVDPSVEILNKLVHMTMRHTYIPLVVEVFFVISGFLTVTNFLRDEKLQQNIARDSLRGNVQRYLRQLLHRFLRLAPMQFVVLLIGTLSMEYQKQVSVFHISDSMDELCPRHWHRQLLFIQNFFPVIELCGNWTWSLACDMQLHMVALLMLFIHTRHPRVVRSLVALILAGNIAYTLLVMEILKVGGNFDDFIHSGKLLYVSPIVRTLAYIVGGAYGYSHVRGSPTPFDQILPNRWAKLGLVFLMLYLTNQVVGPNPSSPLLITIFMIFLRLLLAAGTSHLIRIGDKADTSESYPPIRWLLVLLQASSIQRAGRFTYAIYLLNPIVILNFYYSFSGGLQADFFVIFLLIVAHSVICYVLANALTLIFESPFNRLSSLVLTTMFSKEKSL